MDEKQKNIDHLAIVISNYVALSDISSDNLDILEALFQQLHISPDLEKWWKNRFAVARQNLQET